MSGFRIGGMDSLAEGFAAAVAQFADNEAVRCGARAMTYRELDELSTRWAARLHEDGCAGRPVAVFHHRSVEMVTAILAVVKAGGWYVPLDPATPSRRLSVILRDADPVLVLTSGDLAEQLPVGVPAVLMDDPPPSAALAQARHVPGDSYCYAIFTSGTSGRPKGVAVTHSNVLGLFRAADSLFDVRPDDAWTMFHSIAFDFSVWEMWGALLSGARVVVVPHDVARNPAAFWALLCREGVTVLSQTPTAFSRLIAEDSARAERLPLRWVVLGGEALRFSDCRPWLDKYGEEPPVLVNMYGITETTVHASYHRVRRADLDQPYSIIGRPLPGQDILLLDEDLTAVRPGQAGEIVVTGSGVAAGYLNNPELTRERFIELAGPDGHTVRGYRSGDIAARTPQGDLAYRGRADDQVKIRGHRIELGEIQAALTADAGVRQAAVLTRRLRASGGPVAKQRQVRTGIRHVRDLIRGVAGHVDAADSPTRILAYVVPGDGFDADHMFTTLRERLPDYMMPAYIMPIGEIPVNHSGKLDVDRLPAPSAALAVRPAAPAGGRPERAGGPQARVVALCAAFAEVLGVNGIAEDDSFFSMGGDSILALDLCTAAERRGLTLELGDVYTLQTPRALAAAAAEAQGTWHGVTPFSLLGEADRALLPGSGIEDAYPLARLQAGVLFHSAYGGERNMYCDIFRFRLAARFDREALQAAVDQAIARHDILRSSFHFSEFSEPLQVVHATADCPVTVVDLSGVHPDRQQAAIDAWLEREQRTPYDWGRPPLMRFTAHLLGGDEFVLWMGFHDALLDGWSESALLTEILTEYARHCQGSGGRPAPRPVLRFADFVALERATMRDEDAAGFWSAELAGVEPMLLPRLAAGEQDAHRGRFGFLSVDIDPELSARLEKVSAVSKAPLKHVLLAAHARVQAALNAREEVLLSVEWNGRPEGEGSTEVLGTHLNVVPYRLRTGGLSWAELIDAAWAKERELLPWRRFPYAELLHLVGVADLSDILFNYTHFHQYEALRSTDIQIIDAEGYNQTNLTLRVEFNKDPFTDLLNLDIEANLERTTENQLWVTAELYRNALHALASDVDAVPTLRDLLDEDRFREIMNGFRGPRVPLSEGGWFGLFDAIAARNPECRAAVSGNEEISYGDLRERAGSMAEWLARRGVRRGDVVGLMAQRGISYLIAMLAILRAGAVYLPLPSGPRLRAQRMLCGSDARLVLCDAALVAVVGDTPGETVEVIDLAVAMAQAESLRPYTGPPPGGRDPAYMIFTSGSTGEPKGAVIRHDGMLNHILAKVEALNLAPGDLVSQDAAATFDISIWQWLAPLAAGATTVIYPDAVGQNPPRLLRALAADGVTVLEVTPSVLNVMRAELEHYGAAGYPPFALRWVVSQAETLVPRHANAFLRVMPGIRMLNMWGATEASDDCIHHEIVGKADEHAASVPVGRPIRNISSYVLDDHRDPVPVGTPGELYIAGTGVGAGYRNDEERTAAAFVPDPFDPEAGALMYRTGDRVRQLADGAFEFLGRLDSQLKIRGQRIELGEIVTALLSIPEVDDGTVIVRDVGGERRLTGFFVLRAEGQEERTAASRIRTALGRALPAYAVPDFLVRLDALPRTSHGKVDTRVLAALDVAAAIGADEPDEEPATPAEATILGVWTQILLAGRMAPTSNFFQHGGHSLHATQAMARLSDVFGLDLEVRALFEHPTARELGSYLADELRKAEADRHEAERIPVRPPGMRRFPLTQAQSSLWFLHEFDPGDRSYEFGNLVLMAGPLDVEALRFAIETVTQRHEILATRFGSHNGVPFQHSAPEYRIRLDVEDTGAGAELAADHEAMLGVARSRYRERRFDLVDGPVGVARLYRFSPAAHVLEWSSHHIISDGWSNGIVLREVKEAYLARIEGRAPSLPSLPVQYADYARWQHEFLHSARAAAHIGYWRSHLAGYPGDVGLTTDIERTDSRSRAAGYVTRAWDGHATRRLREFARRLGVTPFTVFHAAVAILVSKLGQRPDVVLGGAAASRSVPGTENLVGFFANTLPFRYQVDLGHTGADLLAQVSGTVVAALDHQLVPFQEIVKTCDVPRRAGVPPLVQVFVAVDAYPFDPSGFGDLAVSREHLPPQASLFDLVFEFIDEAGQFSLLLQYDASLFRPATAERLGDAIDRLLGFLIDRPAEPLTQALLLNEADLRVLAGLWHEVAGARVDFAVPAVVSEVIDSRHWDAFFDLVDRDGLLPALLLAL